MLSLPPPIGPCTEAMFQLLSGDQAAPPPPVPSPNPLGDRDLQLALYVANELHYGGVGGVDDDLEWHPEVCALRTALEEPMLDRLLVECGAEPPIEPEAVPARIFELIGDEDFPPLARYLETQ